MLARGKGKERSKRESGRRAALCPTRGSTTFFFFLLLFPFSFFFFSLLFLIFLLLLSLSLFFAVRLFLSSLRRCRICHIHTDP